MAIASRSDSGLRPLPGFRPGRVERQLDGEDGMPGVEDVEVGALDPHDDVAGHLVDDDGSDVGAADVVALIDGERPGSSLGAGGSSIHGLGRTSSLPVLGRAIQEALHVRVEVDELLVRARPCDFVFRQRRRVHEQVVLPAPRGTGREQTPPERVR
jgi:hypothetical protein